LEILINLSGENHEAVAKSYHNIGLSYHKLGDDKQKLEYFTKCLAVQLKLYGEDHGEVADSYNYWSTSKNPW
jgi:hypothetical protein